MRQKDWADFVKKALSSTEKLNWLILAQNFAEEGNPNGMRSAARELFELNAQDSEGPAIMAEAALYSGHTDEAEGLARQSLMLHPRNYRARYVLAGVFSIRFDLEREITLLEGLLSNLREEREKLKKWAKDAAELDEATGARIVSALEVNRYLFCRADGLLADALYLAANPEGAADALEEASALLGQRPEAGDFYSKHLFLRNYRPIAAQKMKEIAAKYQDFQIGVVPYAHDEVRRIPGKKLRIGYISRDFRTHSVAYFVTPFLRDFDEKNFSVYVYSLGQVDDVTRRMQRFHVKWRDLRGRSPRTAARLIAEDHVDILVDLSGHTQDNALPILAYHAAPVQISAVGYMNTTGLNAMDYFLTDRYSAPPEENNSFHEKLLVSKACHLCYIPGTVREMPRAGVEAPCKRNGIITFGSFNNFAKVTDNMLLLWRAILEQTGNARLIIKGKICSIPSGCRIVRKRLERLNFRLEQVELRPYSPDYLEQYRDIDIALDTAPYTGGLTTCEALFMGVPVITLEGRTHASRFSATILEHAGLSELIANNAFSYVKKAVQIAKHPELIGKYHAALRDHLHASALMDGKGYMREIERLYREAWIAFCEQV